MSGGHPFLPALGRPLVLASASPRRADILRAQGLEFTTAAAEIDEAVQDGEVPAAYVERLALAKARAVADRPGAGVEEAGAVYLGSDTTVVLGGEILGKPADAAEARAMLGRLSGQVHEVFSSAGLWCPQLEFAAASHRVTRVRFRVLAEDEIARYVATGEPMDKAGAYGIQAHGALLVDGIEGCYFNVMGLPLQAVHELWHQLATRSAP